MSRIAILGASSQLARDYLVGALAESRDAFLLYARDTAKVARWLAARDMPEDLARVAIAPLSEYGAEAHDAVLNFIGVGDPAKARAMAGAIETATEDSDARILDYLRAHPHCRYIFLSSGAVYGDFAEPASERRAARIPDNPPAPEAHYARAKWQAECRHRACPEFFIVDLRVFSYFSRSQDIEAAFLVSDLLRALRNDTIFETSAENLVRDILHPDDFRQLIGCILRAAPMNCAIDAYSAAPIEKHALIDAMKQRFGLRSRIVDSAVGVTATGHKSHYYSTHRRAAALGYRPAFTSLDTVCGEATAILAREGILPLHDERAI